ncbi:MAG TPA: hypothetical protein VM661_07580 [Candidatus Sulfotelmatobacter sp.]|nr:hypothetical protein [Candidatus Sulfotelmatobacter sp.]
MIRPVRHAAILAAAFCLTALLAACGPDGPGPGVGGKGPQTSRAGSAPRSGANSGGNGGDQDADRFKGKSDKEILAFLGEPSFRRREAPAEVWQYYGQGCVLDLFLYDETGGQRVTHAELRSRNFNADPDPDCLPLLLQGKRQPMS